MEHYRDIDPFQIPGRPATFTELASASGKWARHYVANAQRVNKIFADILPFNAGALSYEANHCDFRARWADGMRNANIPANLRRARSLHADYWLRHPEKKIVRLTAKES
jgi:hypothetical protein